LRLADLGQRNGIAGRDAEPLLHYVKSRRFEAADQYVTHKLLVAFGELVVQDDVIRCCRRTRAVLERGMPESFRIVLRDDAVTVCGDTYVTVRLSVARSNDTEQSALFHVIRAGQIQAIDDPLRAFLDREQYTDPEG